MTNAVPESDPLPELDSPMDVEKFLAGDHSPVKPLHHPAARWREFSAQLQRASPAASPIRDWGAKLHATVVHPGWEAAHDAAHHAIVAAWQQTNGEGTFTPEDMDRIERLLETSIPGSAQVAAVEHPQLQETLRPLATYLEQWAGEQSPWHTVPEMIPSPSSSFLDDLFTEMASPATPAPFKPSVLSLPSSRLTSSAVNAWQDGHTDHTHCTHGPLWSSHSVAAPGNNGSGGHVHGPTCGHAPPPKGKNALWWTIGTAVTAGVVYCISQYGKKMPPTPGQATPWTDRMDLTETNHSPLQTR